MCIRDRYSPRAGARMASSGARHRSAGVLAHSARSIVGFIGWYSLRHHKDSARSPAHTHAIRALSPDALESPPKACFQSTKRTLCCTRRPVRLACIYFICTVLALQSPIAVSYTHLDVYKRQPFDTVRAPSSQVPRSRTPWHCDRQWAIHGSDPTISCH